MRTTADLVLSAGSGDTHGHEDELVVPDGDILIHSGDVSMWGNEDQVVKFNEWLGRLPHKHKVVVSGNHDPGQIRFRKEGGGLGLDGLRRALSNAVYLQDESTTFTVPNKGSVVVWGSPWQPQYQGFATYASEESAEARWRKSIPQGVDIAVTHTPPAGLLDEESNGRNVGSKKLFKLLREHRPLLSCFGHIHYPGGRHVIKNWGTGQVEELGAPKVMQRDNDQTMFVNGAVAGTKLAPDGSYPIVSAPLAVDLILTRHTSL